MTLARSSFIALAAGAALARPLSVSAQSALTPVRVMGIPNDDASSLIYALKSGMFRKAGLDVTYEKGVSGAAVAAAVAGGSFDVGKSSVTSIYEAHAKGIPFTLIAPAAIHTPASPYAAFLVLKDSPIKTGKDLENKLVSLSSLSSIGRPAICQWVDKNGGDWKSVKFVEVPMNQAPGALEANRIVASEIAQPGLSAALDSGKFRTIPAYDTFAPEYLFSSWFTTKEWSSKHSAAARAFARTIAEAAAYTNAHHADTAPLIAEISGIELAVIQKMTRVVDGTAITPALVQPVIDADAKYGALSKAYPAQEVIDPNAVTR